LAQGLQKVWGGKIQPGAIRRLRHTKTQTGMNKEARKKNLANAMAWNGIDGCAEQDFAIVLVDDVLTTGATLASCWEVVPDALRAKVEVWTLAAAFGS
jgi:predicted amidophosphoribosyltransferase